MALTKVSGDFIQDGSITQGHLHASHGITTSDIGEGSNLYFTTARVNTAVGNLSTSDLSEGTNLYYTDARVGSYLTTNNYVTSSSTHTFTNKSGNISQWTNDSGYITDGNTNWDNSYGFITASSTDTLTNKSGNISMFTNDSGYITDGNTNWNNSYGFITASSTDTLTNKSGNISQWTNDSGYLTSFDITTQTDPKYLRSNAADTLSAAITLDNSGYFVGSPSYGFRFNNSGDTINALIVDNSGNSIAYASHRAPIFYDSSNTAYYAYPTSQSVFYRLKLQGTGTANAATLEIDNPSSSSFIHTGELFTANQTAGQANIFVIGKSGSTKNSGYIGYNWASNASNNNYITIGQWGADHLFRIYGDSVLSTVTLRSDVDMHAPIFYDKNNTNYFYHGDASASLAGQMNIWGGTGSTYGNQLILGQQSIIAPYTLQDTNVRPIIYVTGQYPALTLNHTVTSNTAHGPTLQFTFNGSNARQWVFGASGDGEHLDIGYSDSGLGNTSYNPHHGIAGYLGTTFMTFKQNGNIGIGSAGDWGTLGSGDPGYAIDTRGTLYNNTDVRAPIFYDSNNTAYRADFTDSGNSIVAAGSYNAQNYNKPALLLNASGTGSSGAAFGMQQVTSEGWTGVFVDYEPHTGWGLYHDNPNNYFCVTAENTTGNIRSFTVPSRSSGNRTAYEKIRFDQNNGNITSGGSMYASSYIDQNNTGYYVDPASTSVVNTVHFGNNTNNGYVSGYGTYSLNISRVAQMSLDWNANYNSPSNHGIMSTDSNGNFADSVSINSYNDITLRLDSNNNNSVSYLRVKDATTTSGNDIFTVSQAAKAILGRSGMSPQLTLEYDDHSSGERWDTVIDIGRIQERRAGSSGYPTYVTNNGYGISFQSNSDGVIFGMKEYSSGNYRPMIAWGDDSSDTPMEWLFNNSQIMSLSYNGHAIASGSYRAPIFYDSNDTAYYIDPNSTGAISAIKTAGGAQIGTSTAHKLVIAGNGNYMNINYDQIWNAGGNLHLQYSSSGNIDMNQGGGYAFSRTSLRAPIFYDYNNTGYYVDPASWSNLSSGRVGSYLQIGTTGNTTHTPGINMAIGSDIYWRQSTYSNNADVWMESVDNATYLTWKLRVSSFDTTSWTDSIVVFNHNFWRGYVGILRSPEYPLDLNGQARLSGGYTTSDVRLKKNIRDNELGLSHLLQLRTRLFDWITDEEILGRTLAFQNSLLDCRGFIAQEVEEVVPELVDTSEGDQPTKSIDDGAVTAMMVKAIQEQQAIIDDLKARIEILENQ